jgi:hypothetical protein
VHLLYVKKQPFLAKFIVFFICFLFLKGLSYYIEVLFPNFFLYVHFSQGCQGRRAGSNTKNLFSSQLYLNSSRLLNQACFICSSLSTMSPMGDNVKAHPPSPLTILIKSGLVGCSRLIFDYAPSIKVLIP